jgi:serine O-acetyltransferase
VSQSTPHGSTSGANGVGAAGDTAGGDAPGPSRLEPWVYEPQGPATWRELCSWIGEDYRAHERDWTRPGFRAVAIHRFGNFRMQLAWPLLRKSLGLLYWPTFRYIRNHYGIELPYSVKLGRRVVIEHQGAIVIHGSSQIGDDCILRQGVTLGNRRLDDPFSAPKLGQNVNVGAGAKLLGGINIGDHAAIGANAVVLIDVPAHGTAIGVPAKLV